MPVLEKVPRKDALKAVKLIWATGLYHENIYETAGARVEGGLQTRMAELLRIFGGVKQEVANRPWGGKGSLIEGLIGTHKSRKERLQAPQSLATISELEQLLEQHVERFIAATWKHPLLDSKAAFDAAVTLEIVDSWAVWVRGDARDHILPWDRLQAHTLIGVLALSDAGDPSCNSSSSSLRVLDPRGSASASLPPLLQLGAFCTLCLRSGDLWLLPSASSFHFPPHSNRLDRSILLFSVRVTDVTSPALLDLFLLSPLNSDNTNTASEREPEGRPSVLATKGPEGSWKPWSGVEPWTQLLGSVLVRWPTPLYSTLDPSILALLPAASLPAASSAFWQWGDARAGGEAAGMARLDLIGVSSRSEEVLRREEARGSSTSEEASQEKTWGEAAQAERVRERLEAHLRAALQSLASHPFMTRYNRAAPFRGQASLQISALTLVAWTSNGYSMPAFSAESAGADFSGFWYVASGLEHDAEGGSSDGEEALPEEVRANRRAGSRDGVQITDPRAAAHRLFAGGSETGARLEGGGSKTFGVRPEPGALVIFPSFLSWHHPPNRGPKLRVAVAFHARVRVEAGEGAGDPAAAEDEQTLSWVR